MSYQKYRFPLSTAEGPGLGSLQGFPGLACPGKEKDCLVSSQSGKNWLGAAAKPAANLAEMYIIVL